MNDMNMTMGSALPEWLTPLAWSYLGLSVAAAVAIGVDIYARGHRQRHGLSELVWLLSALWLGPFALPLYARIGRMSSGTAQAQHRGAPRTSTAETTKGGLAGSAASLTAHVVGVPLVLATGWTIAGLDLWVMIIVIAVLATALLALYEHRASTFTRGPGGRSVTAALVVATVTVLAFDIGMGGWMLLLHFNDLMPAADDVRFTLLMQVGIALGFLTGYPAVKYLPGRLPSWTGASRPASST